MLVLGKPPRPGTVMWQVAEALGAEGHPTEVRLPHDHPDALDLPREASLVVHRGLSEQALSHLKEAVDGGSGWVVSCCNPISSVQGVERRRDLFDLLGGAGLPIPDTTAYETWTEVSSRAGDGRVVIKGLHGSEGRGATVAVVDGQSAQPFPGPWVVQELIPHDGLDRKLYVAGDQVSGQMKRSPLGFSGGPPDGARGSERFEPTGPQVALARAVGEVTGLHLYGVDLVEGPAGPVVVDVNVFPGFRGITEGPAQVTAHIRAHLDGEV